MPIKTILKKLFFLLISIVLTLLSTVEASAQAKSNPDSLWSIWNNQTQPDTSRMKALQTLIIDYYAFQNTDSARILGNILLNYARQKRIRKYEAEAHNLIGISWMGQGGYEKSLEHNRKGLQIAEEIKDSFIIGKCLSDMGNSYSFFGDYFMAYKHFQRGLKINRALGNKVYESYNHGNMGNVYIALGDLPRAEECYREQLRLNEVLGDKQSIAGATGNLATVYLEQGDKSKALEHYHKALRLSIEGGFRLFVAINHANLADFHVTEKQYTLAEEHNTKLKFLADELSSSSLLANFYVMQCQIYQGLGKYKESVAECEKGLELSIAERDIELQIEATRSLYEINKSLNRGSEALAYHEKLLALQDTLKKDEANTEIQRAEFNSQLLADSIQQAEEKRLVSEAHVEEVRRKNATRNYLVGTSLGVLLLAGGLWGRLRFARRSKARLQVEKDRSENLLLNILPAEIAEELKQKGRADARDFNMVSILFTDFKEFTQVSEKLTAKELVEEINSCFEAFDAICGKYKIEKIKTIGDAYMAAGGLPVPADDSVKNTVLAAIEMSDFMLSRKTQREGEGKIPFEMRVGIHTGPVVAGIVGVKKFQYDIWGDTVNTASRIESNGEPGKVNISQFTYERIKDDSQFAFKARGKINVKGKGEVEMYFVESISKHK